MREHHLPAFTHSEINIRMASDSFFRMGTAVTAERMLRMPHREENFVVSWMLEGEGVFAENNRTDYLMPGSVCIRRPDHEYRLYLPPKRGVRLFLDLPNALYDAMLLYLPELAHCAPVRHIGFDEILYAEFRDLYTAFQQISSTELYTLFPAVLRFVSKITGITEERAQNPLSVACGLLDDVTSVASLEQIAACCGMNYHTFRRAFCEKYSISPGKYRNKRKIEAACHLLLQGEAIKDIAVAVGYSDVYTFTHRFKEEMGMSPTAYYESKVKFKKTY